MSLLRNKQTLEFFSDTFDPFGPLGWKGKLNYTLDSVFSDYKEENLIECGSFDPLQNVSTFCSVA